MSHIKKVKFYGEEGSLITLSALYQSKLQGIFQICVRSYNKLYKLHLYIVMNIVQVL